MFGESFTYAVVENDVYGRSLRTRFTFFPIGKENPCFVEINNVI